MVTDETRAADVSPGMACRGAPAPTAECSVCGSPDPECVEGESPTGVTAPDVGVEWRRWEAVQCRHDKWSRRRGER
jgi:hypothetical protein